MTTMTLGNRCSVASGLALIFGISGLLFGPNDTVFWVLSWLVFAMGMAVFVWCQFKDLQRARSREREDLEPRQPWD